MFGQKTAAVIASPTNIPPPPECERTIDRSANRRAASMNDEGSAYGAPDPVWQIAIIRFSMAVSNQKSLARDMGLRGWNCGWSFAARKPYCSPQRRTSARNPASAMYGYWQA